MTTADTKTSFQLPHPTERPNSTPVIFDGECSFCRKQVTRLAKWDWNKRLSFVSLHDDYVAQHWPDLTREQLMDEIYLIDKSGKKHPGAHAFRWMTLRLPPLWPLAPLMHFPFSMPVWKLGYRIIARARYRFGKSEDCENGSCQIHFD